MIRQKLNSLPPELRKMKKSIIAKTLRVNTRFLAFAMCIIALITCVSVTFAWFGSTFENLNTVIKMGNYSASVNVINSQGENISVKSAKNSDRVNFDNTDYKNSWQSGSVTSYYIKVKNTGDIDLKSYVSLDCAFVSSKDGKAITEANKFFGYQICDITKNIKNDDIASYAKGTALPDSDAVYNCGKAFSENNSELAGEVNSGDTKVFALYICCSNLPNQYVSDNYNFVLSTSVITAQLGATDVTLKTNEDEIASLIETVISNPKSTTTPNSTQASKPSTAVSSTAQTIQQSTTAVTKPTNATETAPNNSDGWVWKYNDSSKKSVTITAYNGTKTDVIIPSVVGKSIVTKLSDNVFAKSKVKSVTVPACIQNIQNNTFVAPLLKTISFQAKTLVLTKTYSSIYTYDSGAIYTADKTTLLRVLPQCCTAEFKIDANTISICDNAFENCTKLNKLYMNDIKSVGTTTFAQSHIKDYYFYSNNVVVVSAKYAFGIPADTKIHVNRNLKAVYKSQFGFMDYNVVNDITKNIYDSYKLTSINGINYAIYDSTIRYNGNVYSSSKQKNIAVVTGAKSFVKGLAVIPEYIVCDKQVYYVIAIDNTAFAGNKNLKALVLPNHEISYSSDCFEGCTNLGAVQFDDVIPYSKSLKEITSLLAISTSNNG